jgi:hypothetical protein
LSTATNGVCNSLKRPDIIGVLKNGTVRMFEVRSPSQSFGYLRDKINTMKDLLGQLAASGGKVIEP